MPTLFVLFCVLVSFGGCASREETNVRTNTPSYALGKQQGCLSAQNQYSTYGSKSNEEKAKEYDKKNDQYKAGWRAGFSGCSREIHIDNRQMPSDTMFSGAGSGYRGRTN